jgi:dTDP-4-dehydrorhamnose reductase
VFDGAASVPYAEDATPAPVNAYGRSKLAGERAVLEGSGQYGYVVRTAWLYGARGRDFVRTMIRIAAGHGAVDVVADQWGQPTWVADVAERILLLGGGDAPGGVYHATNAGQTSRWGLAREVFLRLGTDPGRVRAVSGADLARPARRGAYTVLGHARWAAAGIPPPRHWRAALSAAWPDLRAAIDEIEL